MEYTLDITREFPAPEFTPDAVARRGWKNGLVVRMPNWLGDAVMALPALHQLKLRLPAECALAVVIPAGLRTLFYALPWVDVIIPLANTHCRWSRNELQTVSRFAAGAGVLFNNSLRDALMMRLASVPELYGAAARCRGIFLTRSFNFPGRRDHVLNKLHHANKYLSIAYALGAPHWDGRLPEIVIARDKDQLKPNIWALCDHPRMLILAAGAAYGAAKRWRSEAFREVAADWIDRGGIAVTVGTAKEAPIGEEIGTGLPAGKFFNMMGQTDMTELMYLLQSAHSVVANDSGVMHLAAAMGRPGVAVFGSTDYSATGPIGGKWKILYANRPCSPCFKRSCPHNNPECMKLIEPAAVLAALREIEAGMQ